MGVLVTYVIPQVATIFEQQNAVLPLMTRILIGLSNFLSNYWLLILIALVGAAAGIMFGLSTKAGRRFYDTWILRLPFIGPTMTRIICARFARTLATLLESGVQLVPALTPSNGWSPTACLEAVEQSRESIREGHGMGDTLRSQRSLSATPDRDDQNR